MMNIEKFILKKYPNITKKMKLEEKVNLHIKNLENNLLKEVI